MIIQSINFGFKYRLRNLIHIRGFAHATIPMGAPSERKTFKQRAAHQIRINYLMCIRFGLDVVCSLAHFILSGTLIA